VTSTPEPAPPTGGISVITATAIVVANMVGTGIFTSLGFQVGDLPSGFVIVVLWAVGGLCAFCGALAYAELAAALPRSGGEYHFLSKIFHPSIGFAAGWISATVAFAAPIALAAMAFGKYFGGITDRISAVNLSLIMVWVITIVHLTGLRTASRFQNTATWLKVLLITVFIVAGIMRGDSQPISFAPGADSLKLIATDSFAISLFYVMYSYAGWNAATYIVGEIRNPQRNVPVAIAAGTILVTILYVALNAVFLHVAPIDELKGKLDVGHVAADHIFGATGGKIMSGLICLGLVSAISAMTWVGPRVGMAMGQDHPILAPLAVKTPGGVPSAALFLQLAIVIMLILTASFQEVLTYIQFSIQLSSFVTVLGMMVLRYTRPELPRPYRCWGYPVTPLIFLALSLWIMGYLLAVQPMQSLAGLATIAVGFLLYFLSPKTVPSPNS
jgi:APA family basic amino acid/polyamine antiporter